MIAVGERLEGLVDEMDAWDEDMEDEESDGEELYDYSDSEKGGDEEEEEGSGEEEEEEEDNEDVKTCGSQDGEHDHDPSSTSSQSHSPPAPIKAELPTLLSLFTLAITRLSSNNSLPTIMNLSTLLPPVLARSADINDIVFARIVVERTNELVETVLAWAKGKNDWSEKGEQKVSSSLVQSSQESLLMSSPLSVELCNSRFSCPCSPRPLRPSTPILTPSRQSTPSQPRTLTPKLPALTRVGTKMVRTR
jgi:hypothetical protein